MVGRTTLFAALACLAVASSPPARADDPKPGCITTAPSTPATPPQAGTGETGASSTAPGQMGATGWSGGTGGSYIGTTPKGSTPSSQSEQPTVATGLDPTKPTASNQTPPTGC